VAKTPALQICGTRGIPAGHGGFETFAEQLALYLAGKGWNVAVYSQVNAGDDVQPYRWRGVEIIPVRAAGQGALATVIFDLKVAWRAALRPGVILTLGYNTAVFSMLYRLRARAELMNMDGLEWKRDKWGAAARAWLYLNERIGASIASHLVADHPVIADRLVRLASEERVTMIPYSADPVRHAEFAIPQGMGLVARAYVLVVARPEPENSILEVVRAFSRRPRGVLLVVLGSYNTEQNRYHAEVKEAASDEVCFIGPLYDRSALRALRFFSKLYVHGHRVGGTNPSLVEALAADNPVLAHDNPFNRWVAGERAAYFQDEADCAVIFDELLVDNDRLAWMAEGSRDRYTADFRPAAVLSKYERLLMRFAQAANTKKADSAK
jgi:glycosyltransferase involved in cell wall biosynthesis